MRIVKAIVELEFMVPDSKMVLFESNESRVFQLDLALQTSSLMDEDVNCRVLEYRMTSNTKLREDV